MTASMVPWLHSSELGVGQRTTVGACRGAEQLPWRSGSREHRREPGAYFLQQDPPPTASASSQQTIQLWLARVESNDKVSALKALQ